MMSDAGIEAKPPFRFDRRVRTIIGLVVTALCLGYMLSQIDFAGVRRALSTFDWRYILIGLVSLAFGYVARVMRWTVMLRSTGAETSMRACAAAFMGSIALNNVLPARLGDVVRAFVFPTALGVPKATSAGSLVLERLIDLLSILAFLVLGLAASAKVELPESLRVSTTILACIATVGLAGIVFCSRILAERLQRLTQRNWGRHQQLIQRGLRALILMFSTFEAMSKPLALASVCLLSVLAWAGESGLFWALLVGFGFAANAGSGMLVMAIATLATLVPSSPGYVGPFHLAAYVAASLMGGTSDQAASFAVLAHACVWLPTSAVGGLVLLVNPSLFAAAQVSQKNR